METDSRRQRGVESLLAGATGWKVSSLPPGDSGAFRLPRKEPLMTSCTANFERTDAASIDLVRMAIEPLLGGQTDVLNRILAVLEASLQEAVDHKSDGPIELIVTQSLQRHFEQRGMYPQYRPEFAAKVLPSKASVFFVSMERAEEVLQYAQEQRKKNDAPRGTAAAFTSLICALERSIRAEKFRGCVEFPGADKVDTQRREASAVLPLGARVKIWYDDAGSGKEATITQSYGPSFVRDPDGSYVKNDQIGEYRFGYIAKHDDSTEFFYPAWQLAPIGESYGHLRLIR